MKPKITPPIKLGTKKVVRKKVANLPLMLVTSTPKLKPNTLTKTTETTENQNVTLRLSKKRRS